MERQALSLIIDDNMAELSRVLEFPCQMANVLETRRQKSPNCSTVP